ncbi:hypothetical protein HHK36_006208 [Tetracentron sinense]|uniref:2Fe-2S ferredoxin-type domain-containing protein n=1 Tax=Tetracentron sinense TaxID=13715 RepID=A0A835DKM5_TETSI|nr:hypothetical protein HHK36_006208 [Tetracentron sinense]
MGILQLNSQSLASLSFSSNFNYSTKSHKTLRASKHCLSFSKARIRAVGTIPGSELEATPSDEPPSIDFAFVTSVLFPDGTPDIHIRSACGGQKLRDIMLDTNIDVHGPYARPLLNCGGGGTCGTCIVEVVEGNGLLSARTDKEKEILKRLIVNCRNQRLGDLLVKLWWVKQTLEARLSSNNCLSGKHMNGPNATQIRCLITITHSKETQQGHGYLCHSAVAFGQ